MKSAEFALMLGLASSCAVCGRASVVTNGTEITFTVAEGVVERYDFAIGTEITKVTKEGAGTMQLLKDGGAPNGKLSVYINSGSLELLERNALSWYNNIYIAKGGQLYMHSNYAASSAWSYATICQYIKGVAGDGPDGTGAIRLDTVEHAYSCFRNEVTLTDDATFTCDTSRHMGFGTGCTLTLNGHALTIAGQGTTSFSRSVNGSPCTVKPGAGGKIVINTPGTVQIDHDAKFEGDASNTLVINRASSLTVSPRATFPWTVVGGNAEMRDATGLSGIKEGTKYLLGNFTHVYSGTVDIGQSGQAGLGGEVVVCSGAVLRCSSPSNPGNQNLWSMEEGPVPALYTIEAGAVVTNKSASTYMNNANVRKFATHNWGDYHQVGSGYFANWNGCGFFGLEAGRVHPVTGCYILGVVGSRGMFQQDGGTLEYDVDMNLSKGGRSDYLMRGGTIKATGGKILYLAREDDAGYPKADPPDDFVSFSLVGPNSPCADIDGVIRMNSRTGVTTSINIDAGRLSVKHLQLGGSTSLYKSYLNLNGGTFAMRTNAWSYLCAHDQTPVMTTIYGNGVTFELNRTERTFLTSMNLDARCSYALRGAHGRGIKSVKLPANMPKTGYRGVLPAKVVNAEGDTTGNGAQAALDFDVASGTVKDDLIILCPGCDYTAAPKICVYGADYATTYECAVELTDADQVPGAFVKTGPGELVLNTGKEKNTYAGPYVISNGTLMVNYNSLIPASSEVVVAGGCFRWDWRNLTIARFGGHGTYFGSRDNNPQTLTVTDAFTVDADDLNAGRHLAVDTVPSEEGNGKTARNDAVQFGANCRVFVRNAERLDADAKGFLLLRQEQAITAMPTLATEIANARLVLRKDRTELWLKRTAGMLLFVR